MCTSGTAVANLHPAVLEAAHAGVGLVVVTADRPARLRGTGANQTTDQVGIFGPLVPSHDLATRDDDLPDDSEGPLHLNVQLDEPLVPTDRWTPDRPDARSTPSRRVVSTPTRLQLGPRTVVVAGDDSGPPARQLAETAGWPLLAEPTSGARTGAHALRCYRLLLDGDLGRSIERVVVFGRPTLSRPVTRLLGRDDVEVLEVPARGVWPGRPFPVAGSAPGYAVDGADDPAWLDAWREADRSRCPAGRPAGRGRGGRDAVGGGGRRQPGAAARRPARRRRLEPDPRPRPDGGGAPGGRAPQDDRQPRPVGHRRRGVHRRRRRAGPAAAQPRAARRRHLPARRNGLVLGPGQPEPDLTLVVVNDDGGSIFATLEQGDPAHADRYEALFGTPHGVDLAALCAATRTPHWRVGSLPELEQALASPNGGIEVVEVPVRRHDRRDVEARLRTLAP